MSFDPDTTRIVRSWLDEGVTELPDRVLDSVLDQVPATPQRRAIPWPMRRLSTMNTTLKFGLAAVVVAVTVLIGINYLGNSTIGGPSPADPTPTLDSTPTATPVATASPAPEGLLPEGPHVLRRNLGGVPMTVTISAPDWYGRAAAGILSKSDNVSAPDGAGMIVFGERDLYVYGDPCLWQATRPEVPVTTVDEAVAALAAQPSRDASVPIDVTIDGYTGKSIILHVPDEAVFLDCDEDEFRTLVEGVDGSRHHQDPGQIDRLWILDVDGTLVVIDTAYYAETPQSVIDELEAIVESTTFGD